MEFVPLIILILIYGGVILAVKSMCYPRKDRHNGIKRNKYLFRSQNNRVFSGVCGGLAEYFGYSATTVRVIFLVTGTGVFTYAILSYIIPESPSSLL